MRPTTTHAVDNMPVFQLLQVMIAHDSNGQVASRIPVATLAVYASAAIRLRSLTLGLVFGQRGLADCLKGVGPLCEAGVVQAAGARCVGLVGPVPCCPLVSPGAAGVPERDGPAPSGDRPSHSTEAQ
jgi:hypothetical protein